ncbi:ethionine resistance protein [Coemansia asiatica]|uniref:Ethionine resistance protein n=1 Tax=Coemansia asiatica TaxID=1052880 RepID=A0A9W8CLI2_9FUNG|nr:ethionine resistance protein [Coemansia asiatica]
MNSYQKGTSCTDIATEATQLIPEFESADTIVAAVYADASANANFNALQSHGYLQERTFQTSQILKQEAMVLLKTSFPVVLTYLLQYSFSFVNLLVLGHIGSNELAAAALGNMMLMVVVYSPSIGLASALDTFCSTAFTASRDKTLVGFHLQRGLIAVSLQFVVIAPMMWYLDSLLIWLNQDPHISELCGQYVRVQLSGMPALMYFECITRFLQAQGMMHASTYILLAILPVHLVSSLALVWSPTFGFGFLGAAFANVLTNWLIFISIVLYTRYSKASDAWGGWTVQAVRAMPPYFKLAVPSMIMVCSEWWILDLLVLAASYLGNTTLAAQSIIVNTTTLAYQVPDGLSIAVCNRVGNLIGQTRARRARLSAWLGISAGVLVGLTAMVTGFLVGPWWGKLYSDDPQVVACVAMLMPTCAVFQMMDSINSVESSVLRSLGRQDSGALINFPAYYLLGFPLGLFLTYGAPHVGVLGFWYGISLGVSIAVCMQLAICISTNWNNEVAQCMIRVLKDQSSLNGTDNAASSAATAATADSISGFDGSDDADELTNDSRTAGHR